MTQNEILSESVISEAFAIEDEIKRTIKITELQQRAKELKCVRQFDAIVKAFNNTLEAARRSRNRDIFGQIVEGITNFEGIETQLKCGQWIASNSGITIRNPNPAYPDHLACYHPILIKSRMRNIQTQEEQVELLYKRRHEQSWNTIMVPKSTIASQQKIVELAKYGIAVTSENAKWLVSYLSDIENMNDAEIPLVFSSGKLGWVRFNGKDSFIPYQSNGIEFDSDLRFGQLYQAIADYGNEDIWLEHVKALRASRRPELLIMLAASFASILIKPCGNLPFIVDLWGDTEGGKTVTLMVATSVWADPANNVYIGDYKTTDTALEMKADVLNSFPLILDDTSTISKKMHDSMEGLIYNLCSGKGRSRSNKSLGINRENTWNCAVLTCGERPLQDYAEQGGAINRIIEIHCNDYLYKDPHETAEIVKNNYGFWGKFFAMAISKIDFNELERQKNEIFAQINKSNMMQKQAHAMSVILLADRLIEKHIFQDGITINLDDALNVMTERDSVSDNQRAYEYLIDMVNMNPTRFDPVSEKGIEQWGFRSDDYINFYTTALDNVLKAGGFSLKPFLMWLDKKRLLIRDNDGKHMTKLTKINGKSIRVYKIKVSDDSNANIDVPTDEDFTQIKLDLYGLDDLAVTGNH